MPLVTSLTLMVVFFEMSSVSRLLCSGSRCWTRTKAMPVSSGRLVTSSVKASIPPAEAPMAAIKRSLLGSGDGESLSFGELRGLVRPDDFDFICSLQGYSTRLGNLSAVMESMQCGDGHGRCEFVQSCRVPGA